MLLNILAPLLLLLLGNGVVANVVLTDTKGQNSGWIVITTGWGLAVFVAVVVAGPLSGAHLNPAVTLALAIAGKFAWATCVALYYCPDAGRHVRRIVGLADVPRSF